MSWESTVTYYRIVNEGIKNKLGGYHSAKICLYSVDFAEIEKLQQAGDWSATAEILADAAQRLQTAGADFLLICTNTMHKVAAEIESAINIPILHIADATAAMITDQGLSTVGLLGTKFTMEQDFYKGRLSSKFGIKVLTPGQDDRQLVHHVIFDELCLGQIRNESRAEFLRIINQLADQGAQAVILGCTEISLLVQPGHSAVRLFDTTQIHAEKAVEKALSDQ